jgi:hypothetical protein
MRSRKDLPGSWVISTTIRSERTRVPVDRGDPLDDGAVAGDRLPRLDHDDVAAGQLRRRFLAAVAQVGRGLGPHRPQARRLGAAAPLGQRLGEAPKTWISQATVVIRAPTSTTNMTGLRTWTRGSSLRTDSSAAGRMIAGSKSERALASELI